MNMSLVPRLHAAGLMLLAPLLMMSSGLVSAAPSSQLSVDGSAFVLQLADGKVLKGVELQGATLHLAMAEHGTRPLRLTTITVDPQDPAILRHQFDAQGPDGAWHSACKPNFQGETWGFPIALPEHHPGREGAITITCASGAVGKCARFGYKPWAKGPQGEDLLPYHGACVHMVRADYCGKDEPHTRDGTTIDMYDDAGIQKADSAADPDFSFEAGWAPTGATCVARTRWAELLTLDQLHQSCPRLAQLPSCTEPLARERGALLFNRSKNNRTP